MLFNRWNQAELWRLGAAVALVALVTLFPAKAGLDPVVVDETAKLTADDGGPGDRFGFSVAADGSTVVVGARYHDNEYVDRGAAYVFVRDGIDWGQEAILMPADPNFGGEFGRSSALSGDTVVVGAKGFGRGSVHVFVRDGSSWSEQATLEPAVQQGGDEFGAGVSIDGDTLVAGAPFDYDSGPRSGSAYVFVRDAGVWAQQVKLLASDGAASDFFGETVGVSGDTVIVGARIKGAAYVFVREAGVWREQAKLSVPGVGFGSGVAISGDTAVVGAFADPENGPVAGAAYVFVRQGETWSQQAKLLADDGAAQDRFGLGVGISGDVVVVGAPNDDDRGESTGAAYAYLRCGTSWIELGKLVGSDAAAGDELGGGTLPPGGSVAVSGGMAVAGARGADDLGDDSGSARVYSFRAARAAPARCPEATTH